MRSKTRSVFWKVTLRRLVNTSRRFQRQQCLHCRSQAASLFFDCFTLTRKALRSFQTPLNHRVSFVAFPSTATAKECPGDPAAVLGAALLFSNNATSYGTCSSCNIPARNSKVKICVRELPDVWQLTIYRTQETIFVHLGRQQRVFATPNRALRGTEQLHTLRARTCLPMSWTS